MWKSTKIKSLSETHSTVWHLLFSKFRNMQRQTRDDLLAAAEKNGGERPEQKKAVDSPPGWAAEGIPPFFG